MIIGLQETMFSNFGLCIIFIYALSRNIRTFLTDLVCELLYFIV